MRCHSQAENQLNVTTNCDRQFSAIHAKNKLMPDYRGLTWLENKF